MRGGVIGGTILIALGALFLLDNYGLVDARDVFRFWPLLLIALGLARLLRPRRDEERVGGVVLLFLGSVFLLRALHVPWVRFRLIWPVLLVVLGGVVIWQALRRREGSPAAEPPTASEEPFRGTTAGLAVESNLREGAGHSGSVLHQFVLMGGGEGLVRAQDFRGGEVTAIMGGFQVDLRGAGLAGDSATIEVFTLFGGVEFKVPPEWNVVMNGSPILGVFTNSTRPLGGGQAPGKTLIVRGTAIMGGVEVKN
jgi:predicted membrane protein